jgi:hypothetical protein
MNIWEEKAKELVDKFMPHTDSDWETNDLYNAIECALILVDEMLKVLISYAGKEYDYYLEVKKEIIKLK